MTALKSRTVRALSRGLADNQAAKDINNVLTTRASQLRIINTGAKVGATSGFAVKAADDVAALARCPASQTAATCVVPLTGLKVGDVIDAIEIIGQIESAGGAVTVDAALHVMTAVAADPTSAAVTGGGITQISASADTAITAANGRKALTTPRTVAASETFFVLITVTTAASTDVQILSVNVEVTETL